MTLVAGLFGILLIAVGVLGVVSPTRLIAMAAGMRSQRGLYVAAVIRLVFGSALVLVAGDSRAPGLLRVYGWITLVAGALTPFFGVDRFAAVHGWWSRQPRLLLRAWGAVVLALGGSIVWAIR